jgi:hypothetical protein
MPYSPHDLNTEVLAVIAERSTSGESINRAWVVTAVLLAHPLKRPSKKDPDEFSVCCRQLAVSAAVDVALARLKYHDEGHGDPDVAPELNIPKVAGYKHLRALYPVRRDGAIMFVRLTEMTDDEITTKAKTYRKARDGYGEHADELDRYLAARRMPGAA